MPKICDRAPLRILSYSIIKFHKNNFALRCSRKIATVRSSNADISNSIKFALAIGHWQLGFGNLSIRTQCNALLE